MTDPSKMTSPEEALVRIRDHSVGTTDDGACIECEHMIEWAEAVIPVAQLHEEMVGLLLNPPNSAYTKDTFWEQIEEFRNKLEALK